ncbi:MAG: ribosomal-processing cysteine protease Prp [Clostridia bacterium]|nr:ribosomal-processing cysteine protease Prp [Clostridia bacterium]
MIRFKFLLSGNAVTGFDVAGHAGYGNKGSDIVCAAVSSAAYLAANTLTDCFQVGAVAAQDPNGRMTLTVPPGDEAAQQVLKGLEHHIRMLSEQYPDCIKIIYGGNNNA